MSTPDASVAEARGALPAVCAAYPARIDHGTTADLRAALAAARAAGARRALVFPVGSVEPHGPHLPLATDTILAAETARLAVETLRNEGVFSLAAPALPYGVTDFAVGFAGALTVPAEALIGLLVGVAGAALGDGFETVCLVNHHLEPGQLAALETARARIVEIHGAGAARAPSVVSRRWGKHLGAEFKSGACHAGSYETSLVLAAEPERVNRAVADALPALDVSLSVAIAAGTTSFAAAGMHAAYTGHPAEASAAEGARLYAAHAAMVVAEVLESFDEITARGEAVAPGRAQETPHG